MYKLQKSDRVKGYISLGGAKNSALPILIAAGMCKGDVVLHNVPSKLNDVKVLTSLMRDIGFDIEVLNDTTVIFHNNKVNILKHDVGSDAAKIRYSLLLLSLLLSRCGQVRIPSPGGCNLGDRKYDIHLASLQKMGAELSDENGYIYGTSPNGLRGTDLTFHTATTSGSENVILAASLAIGKTIVRNANTRPEVTDLVHFLIRMGANIRYHARYIEVEGVDSLDGGEYCMLCDCHEAVSFMILACMARGEICIKDFTLSNITEDVALLRRIGMDVFEWGGNVYASAVGKELQPFNLTTAPYPGINSDMQPLFAALAATIPGESIITDTRFAERFQYVGEFQKMGINIVNYQNCAVIHGGSVRGADVNATDLRGGAALTLLGCVADGVTLVQNTYQVERGYENFPLKLNSIGCKVES